MNTQKLWQSLTSLNSTYSHLINCVISDFAQEVIDLDSFYNNGPGYISIDQTIETLQETLDNKHYKEFENAALEFCITNKYIVHGSSWNCIDHWITHHKNLFHKNDLRYLKALNDSYVSVYRVVSVTRDKSIKLQNMIETGQPFIHIDNKAISNILEEGSFAALRLLPLEDKSGDLNYTISNTFIPLPDEVAQSSINAIKMMMQVMNSHLIKISAILATPENNLLQKKLWIKEILEKWYIHYCNKVSFTDEPVLH